jgi:hypothetical protein
MHIEACKTRHNNDERNKNLNAKIKLDNVFDEPIAEFEELIDCFNYLFKSDFT